MTIPRMKSKLILPLILLNSILSGCASQNTAELKNIESKQIVDIILNETPDAHILSIRGNRPLTYSQEHQKHSKDLIFFFPDTSLNGIEGHYIPPASGFIRYIKTGQYTENQQTVSAVYIALAKDSPREVIPDKSGLQVTFLKSPAVSAKKIPPKEFIEQESESPPFPKSVPIAANLNGISTEPFEDAVSVYVNADGTIKKYKDFTMANPDRIVFDIYDIKSPYHGEQRIAVQSRWVKRIRHFGHPDKLRLVIEPLNLSISQYMSRPTDDGLIIHVGKKR